MEGNLQASGNWLINSQPTPILNLSLASRTASPALTRLITGE